MPIVQESNKSLDHALDQTRDSRSKIGVRQFTRRSNKLLHLFLKLECLLFQTKQITFAL